jgi:hypothetical protein
MLHDGTATTDFMRGLSKICKKQAALHSVKRAGMRASISDVCVREGSLRFSYTLERVELGAVWLFKPIAHLTISYMDGARKPLWREDRRISVDRAFAGAQQHSMVTSISAHPPADARFFSVELRGFGLATGQTVIPGRTGKR